MSETDLKNEVMLALSRGACRLLRINVGLGYLGTVVKRTAAMVTLRNYRAVKFAQPGVSDLIGWRTITVTPEMIGKRIAIFAAVELKFGDNTATEEQAAFINVVLEAGGMAGVAYSVEEAKKILLIR